jgi:hypothetical protein
LVIWYHGLGDNVNTFVNDVNCRSVVNALTSAGYIVASGQFHDNNWGNQNCLNDSVNLYSSIAATLAIGKTIQLGVSMGGFGSTLSYLSGNFPRSVGWIGIYPAVNLANMYSLNRGSVETAYGIDSSGSDYASKTSGHDPVLFSTPSFSGFNLKSYASPDDVAVPKSLNADALYTLALGQAATDSVVVCSGGHGDPSHYQPASVLAACNAWCGL